MILCFPPLLSYCQGSREGAFLLSTNQAFFSSKCYPFVSCLSHDDDFKMKLLELYILNKLQALPGPGVLAAADPTGASWHGPCQAGKSLSLLALCSDSQHKAKRVCTEELHEVHGIVAYKRKDMYLGNNKGNGKYVSME